MPWEMPWDYLEPGAVAPGRRARTSRLFEQITDLGQQLFLPGRFRRCRCGFVLALQLVQEANDQKQHEGDDDEVQRQREEIAPGQHRALLLGVGPIARGNRVT